MADIDLRHPDLERLFESVNTSRSATEMSVNLMEGALKKYGKSTDTLHDEMLLALKDDIDANPDI